MGYGEGRYVRRAGGHRMLKSLEHLVCQNRATTENATSVRMFQETPPNHERLESRPIMFASGDVLCSYESLWSHRPPPAHAYQGCLAADEGAVTFWFAFACGVFLTADCTQLADTLPGYIKRNHNVRNHLPVSSRDMHVIQLSYSGRRWKLSPSQMKDVPQSWVHIVKWM